MRNDDVRMVLGAMQDFRENRIANKRWAEKQILDQAMREREEQRYKDQKALAEAMAARDEKRLDWQMGHGNKAAELEAAKFAAGAKGRMTKEDKDAIELELLRHQRDQILNPPAPSAANETATPSPMFNIKGQFDPDTGERMIQSFEGKVDEGYLNNYLKSMQEANAAPELQPNLQAQKKPGFFQRMKGVLPANGAGTQYLNALNQSVGAGEMTQEEAERAFAAKRAQAGIW